MSAVADIITERFDMSDLVAVRPLPFEDFTSVVKEVAKQGNDFRTLNKVLADDEIEEVLKHYYIRVGGNLRALDLILRNVSREGQKGADAVIKQVEQWYKERVKPIQRKLDDGKKQMKFQQMENKLLEMEKQRMDMFMNYEDEEEEEYDEDYKEQFRQITDEEIERHIGLEKVRNVMEGFDREHGIDKIRRMIQEVRNEDKKENPEDE